MRAREGCHCSLNAATDFVTPKGSILNSNFELYFEHGEWHVLAMEWDLMIRRLHIDFRNKISVLSSLIKQVSHNWEGEGILGRITIKCLRKVNHHPSLGTVPNEKNLSPPGIRGNLIYALVEHAGNLGLHESDVLRFFSERFCTMN